MKHPYSKLGTLSAIATVANQGGVAMYGDSITDQVDDVLGLWIKRPVKSFGIGGETSAEILARARGLVAYPSGQELAAGNIVLRANQTTFPREWAEGYENQRNFYRHKIATPDRIAWSLNGVPVGTTDGTLSSRIVTANTTAGTLEAVAIDYIDGDRCFIHSTGALPAPLVSTEQYLVTAATADSVRLRTTPTGDPINLTDAGSGTITLYGPPLHTATHAGGAAMASVICEAETRRMETIIWAGHNDATYGTATLANIAAIAATVTGKVWVCTVLNNVAYNAAATGSALTRYNELLALNTELLALYGASCIDVRAALLAAYIEGTDDPTDHANGIIAERLRIDAIHLSSAGIDVACAAIRTALAA